MSWESGERRVAMVSPYSLEHFGGVQGQVLGIAGALQRRGISVDLVAPGADSERDGLTVFGVGPVTVVPANGSRAPIALGPSTIGRVRAVLSRHSYDVVHLHEPFVPLVGPAALLADAGANVATFHRAGVGRLYPAYGRVLGPLAARVDRSAAVSQAALETVHAAVPAVEGGLCLLGNGVDVARFGPRPKAAGPRILFVGRHERRKGLEVLLEAFQRVECSGLLEVVGVGPETSVLTARYAAPGRIEFLGALPDEELARRFAEATVFVAPALSGESFGVVLLEAMASGTAVIASDLPGYRSAAGEAARYVEPGNPAALSQAIEELLEDRSARTALERDGLERSRANSFDALAASYLELYESAIALRRSRRLRGRR